MAVTYGRTKNKLTRLLEIFFSAHQCQWDEVSYSVSPLQATLSIFEALSKEGFIRCPRLGS
jgi:hypothetical protein